jgi:hypothetical protein
MGIFNGKVSTKSSRELIAEAIQKAATDYHLDEMDVGIHEVTDPQKGKTWLGLYLRCPDHQTEVRVYGARFIMFRTWRPFMGKDGRARTAVFKELKLAEDFIENCLVKGIWAGKLSA